MINYIYQLTAPKVFNIKYSSISKKGKVIVKPNYLSICHADQRYYLGNRDISILRKKLPMALIHEACGKVVYDDTNTYKVGQKVVMIPNTPNPEEKSDVIFENYTKGSKFLSSGYDGFMREFVDMPLDRVVPYEGIPDNIAAITEFVSVGVHAITRFKLSSHKIRNSIGVWGDGSLAYVVASILCIEFPKTKIYVIGKNIEKLKQFTFVNKTYLADELPDDFNVDHAFECAGGEGSYYAIDDIIKYINPQGYVMLMGVSENKVSINTRNILEKGLSFIGCSRSGREDFKKAIEYMENKDLDKRLKTIICEDSPVSNIGDVNRVFANDLNNPFKTVFKWNM